jgi:hypothetical protein
MKNQILISIFIASCALLGIVGCGDSKKEAEQFNEKIADVMSSAGREIRPLIKKSFPHQMITTEAEIQITVAAISENSSKIEAAAVAAIEKIKALPTTKGSEAVSQSALNYLDASRLLVKNEMETLARGSRNDFEKNFKALQSKVKEANALHKIYADERQNFVKNTGISNKRVMLEN